MSEAEMRRCMLCIAYAMHGLTGSNAGRGRIIDVLDGITFIVRMLKQRYGRDIEGMA